MGIPSSVRILVADFFALKSLLRPSPLSASTTRFLRTLPHGIQASSNAIRQQSPGFHAFYAIRILLVSLEKKRYITSCLFKVHLPMARSNGRLHVVEHDWSGSEQDSDGSDIGVPTLYGLIECGDELE